MLVIIPIWGFTISARLNISLGYSYQFQKHKLMKSIHIA